MPTIVWDVDDVLNDLTRCWFERAWLAQRPHCALAYDALKENPPHRILGVSEEDNLRSLDRFRSSKEAAGMVPDAAVLEWFERHGWAYRHVALTARPRASVVAAFQWLVEHFGPWFQTFAYVPSERPGVLSLQPDRTKAEYLQWLGRADIFVDDSPAHCRAAARLGIRTYLVDQPWNGSRMNLVQILLNLVPK